MRLDRIGDVLLSTPVIKALRDACPECYLAFMVTPYAKDIVDGNPFLDEVIVYDRQKYGNGMLGNIKFALFLAKKRFDAAVILHPTSRTHVITAMAGIPRRIGYDKKMGWLLTKRVPHTKQLGLRHETDYALDILRYLGISQASGKMYMPVKEESERRARDMFAGAGIGGTDTVVVVNPGASCPSKRWRPENFAKAADAISKNCQARIVIISDDKDRTFAGKVAESMKAKALDLSGKTTVSDLASILKRAKLFISNDSGPVHIACAVGTPVVAIFGRSDRGLSPQRWGPSGARDIALHKYVGCEVCLAHNCKKGFACLEAITPDEVAKAAEKILKGRP